MGQFQQASVQIFPGHLHGTQKSHIGGRICPSPEKALSLVHTCETHHHTASCALGTIGRTGWHTAVVLSTTTWWPKHRYCDEYDHTKKVHVPFFSTCCMDCMAITPHDLESPKCKQGLKILVFWWTSAIPPIDFNRNHAATPGGSAEWGLHWKAKSSCSFNNQNGKHRGICYQHGTEIYC